MKFRLLNGFALTEVVVASLLLSLLGVAFHKFFSVQLSASKALEGQSDFRLVVQSLETVLSRDDLCAAALRSANLNPNTGNPEPMRFAPSSPDADQPLDSIWVGTKRLIKKGETTANFKVSDLSLIEVPGSQRSFTADSMTYIASLTLRAEKVGKILSTGYFKKEFILSVTTETYIPANYHKIKRCRIGENRNLAASDRGFNKFLKGHFSDTRDAVGSTRLPPNDGPFNFTVMVPFRPLAAFIAVSGFGWQEGFKNCQALNSMTVIGPGAVQFSYVYAHQDSPSCPGCTDPACSFDYFILGED